MLLNFFLHFLTTKVIFSFVSIVLYMFKQIGTFTNKVICIIKEHISFQLKNLKAK